MSRELPQVIMRYPTEIPMPPLVYEVDRAYKQDEWSGNRKKVSLPRQLHLITSNRRLWPDHPDRTLILEGIKNVWSRPNPKFGWQPRSLNRALFYIEALGKEFDDSDKEMIEEIVSLEMSSSSSSDHSQDVIPEETIEQRGKVYETIPSLIALAKYIAKQTKN